MASWARRSFATDTSFIARVTFWVFLTDEIRRRIRNRLDEAQEIARRLQVQPHSSTFGGVWQGLTWATEDWGAHTAVDAKSLQQMVERATAVPEGFALHRTLQRMVKSRRAMSQ